VARNDIGYYSLAGEARLMGWAVILLPDEKADASARRVWRAVQAAGFRSVSFEGDSYPHVSLMLLETQDGTLEAAVQRFAAGTAPAAVSFASVSSFGQDVIYLSPEPTAALYEMNRSLTREMGALAALADPHYLPGEWRPHMSAAFSIPEGGFKRAMRAVKGSFAPFRATFGSVAVVKYNPVKLVGTYALGGNTASRTP
jgi:2'-5' RNA ligase